MKQRTYLIIFVKQTTYLITLPDRSPRQRNSKTTKRNLFCATPLRSRDLIRLANSGQTESSPNATASDTVIPTRIPLVSVPQCVGEMIFCVHEPQYAAQDPSFGYNI
jgi:hypothetical protein